MEVDGGPGIMVSRGVANDMIWLAFSIGVIVAIGCLWWFAMRQRKHQPPQPTRAYREWKD